MGSGGGHKPVSGVDHQHSFFVKGHTLGNQLATGCLGAKGQGSHHVAIVMVSNDVQRHVGDYSQGRPRNFHGGQRSLQHMLSPALDQRIVVIDRYYSLGDGKPLKPAVQVHKDLLLSLKSPACFVLDLEGIGHSGARWNVVVAACQKFRFAADAVARLKFHLPVGAAGSLSQSLHDYTNFLNFVWTSNFNVELDVRGEVGFHPVVKHLNFRLLGFRHIGPVHHQKKTCHPQQNQSCSGEYCSHFQSILSLSGSKPALSKE